MSDSVEDHSPTGSRSHTAGSADEPPKLRRPAVLRRLIRLYENPRYLEIGVRHGVTFDRVPAARKVAVDPLLDFDVPAALRANPHHEYHEVTSDEYFATIVDPDDRFDVIYLDGLHVYEQTLRDLMNALNHLQPQGVIVIDDTRPPTYLASIPGREDFFRVREYLGTTAQAWMGDVYRLVWFLETFCPHLSYGTILDNHGQTVVWRQRRTDYPQRSLAEVAGLTFEDMVREEEVLRLEPFGRIRTRLRQDLGL